MQVVTNYCDRCGREIIDEKHLGLFLSLEIHRVSNKNGPVFRVPLMFCYNCKQLGKGWFVRGGETAARIWHKQYNLCKGIVDNDD